MQKQVVVQCQGAAEVEIDQLDELQGELKELSREAFGKLREEIVQRGFSAPFFVWRTAERMFVLDGTQRLRTLKKMREDGWAVPPLPVVWVSARDEAEARRKLLSFVSQYGRVTDQGLYEFLHEGGFDAMALENVEIPNFDVPTFAGAYFEQPQQGGQAEPPKAPPAGSKEIPRSAFDDLSDKCPRCNFPLKARDAAAE